MDHMVRIIVPLCGELLFNRVSKNLSLASNGCSILDEGLKNDVSFFLQREGLVAHQMEVWSIIDPAFLTSNEQELLMM